MREVVPLPDDDTVERPERPRPTVPPEEYDTYRVHAITDVPPMADVGSGYRNIFHLGKTETFGPGLPRMNRWQRQAFAVERLHQKILSRLDEILMWEAVDTDDAEVLIAAWGSQSRVAHYVRFEGARRRATWCSATAASRTPWVHRPDVLVAMHHVALEYRPEESRPGTTDLSVLKPEALVIVDSVFVERVPPMPPRRIVRAPLTVTADAVGMRRAANMVLLGLVARLTGFVDVADLEATVRDRVPSRFLDTNLQALHAGHGLEDAALEPLRPVTA
jgi:hypothetical protein